MAEERESIIIDVQFQGEETATKLKDVQQAMRFLQNENAALKKQMKDLDRTTAEGAEAFAKLSTQYAINTEQIKSLKVSEQVLQQAQMDLGVQATITGDSFKEQARQLTVMKNAYSQMSKAERESASGQEFLKKLQELDAQVKANDASMGNFQRNVGNYPKVFDLTNTSIGKLVAGLQGMGGQAQTTGQFFGNAFSQMTTGLKGFGKAFLTPPIAVITVVVGAVILVFQKLQEMFKKNDAAMTTLQKAFASFEPIIQAVNAMVMKLVEGIAAAVGWIGKMVAVLADWATGSEGAAEAAQDLVQAEDDLQQKEREYTENSAKRSAEISELRAKAAEKDKYTAKERQDMLQQAIDLEKQNLADEKAIAAERLRILEARAEQENDTSDETQDKIAEAKAAMYRAEENYNNGVRRLEGQRAEAAREEMRTLKENAKERERVLRDMKDKEAEIMKMGEDFALSQIQDEGQRRIAQMKLQGEREIAELKKRLRTEENLTAASRDALSRLIESKQADLEKRLNDAIIEDAESREQEQYEREKASAERILALRLQLSKEWSEERLSLEKEQLKQQMQQRLEQENITNEERLLIRAAFDAQIEQLDEKFNEHLREQTENQKKTLEDAKAAYRDAMLGMVSALGSAFDAMAELLESYGEQNEQASAAAKAFAFMSIIADEAIIIANTAKAISSAIAGAAEAASMTGPMAPIMLATNIATMVGAVLSAVASTAGNINKAKQLVTQSGEKHYAEGGVVRGSKAAGDNIPARLTAGEVVLNADQQARLLYSLAQGGLSTGGNIDAMKAAMSEALREMPAPVMVYSEFERFTERTTEYREVANI
ncbi:MAG: hypothetical protein UHD05_06575 [Ruminococcus sp.]|nr:hypothetical protein [Ruminococcus sp.]